MSDTHGEQNPEFMNIQWETPPEPKSGIGRIWDYEHLTLILMDRPHQWAKLPNVYASVPNKPICQRFGLEATGRKIPRSHPAKYTVYMRYVGGGHE